MAVWAFDGIVLVEFVELVVFVVAVVVDVVCVEEAAEVVGLVVVVVRIVVEMDAEHYADRLWTAHPVKPQQYP